MLKLAGYYETPVYECNACGGRCTMVVVSGVIAILILTSVIILQRFMKDMAIVEKELLKEIKEMKQCLIRINEKQL